MSVDRRGFLSMAAGAWTAGLAACAGRPSDTSGGAPPLDGLWQRHVPGSMREVDHSALAFLLERYVLKRSDGVHLFAYGDLDVEDRTALDDYIRTLSGFAIDSLDRREQYAYWLNLYNALVLRLVISRYLVLSIRDITFGLGPFGDGPFERPLVAVLGQPVSLSDIRSRILWPIFKDPRLHYGLCDAAVGSPNLQPRVFTGERVDRMLDGAALDYVNHPRGVRLDGQDLVLSDLYRRYAPHFGGDFSQVAAHLRLYGGISLLPSLRAGKTVRYAFDWALNDGTGLRN
jgi:hypothetical protein